MSSVLAWVNTLHSWREASLFYMEARLYPPSELHRNGALRKRLLHHFFWWLCTVVWTEGTNNENEHWLRWKGQIFVCQNGQSHPLQKVLLCHSSPQLFYLPGSTWMGQLWCKYQMPHLQWAPSARIICCLCSLVVESERAAMDTGLWGCTDCAAEHLPK